MSTNYLSKERNLKAKTWAYQIAQYVCQTNFVIFYLITLERIYESGVASQLYSMTRTRSFSAFEKTSEWNQDIQGFLSLRVGSMSELTLDNDSIFHPLTNPPLDAVRSITRLTPSRRLPCLLIGLLVHCGVVTGYQNIVFSLMTTGSISLSCSADLFFLVI